MVAAADGPGDAVGEASLAVRWAAHGEPQRSAPIIWVQLRGWGTGRAARRPATLVNMAILSIALVVGRRPRVAGFPDRHDSQLIWLLLCIPISRARRPRLGLLLYHRACERLGFRKRRQGLMLIMLRLSGADNTGAFGFAMTFVE